MRPTLRLTLAVLAALAAGQASANVVDAMRVVGDAERTRFVIDLEQPPEYDVSRLVSPYRLVIDLQEVEFRSPAEPGSGRGLVSDYRYGLIAEGRARIVLDLSGPVDVVNSFVLDPMEGEPARLVIDLVPGDEGTFAAAAAADRAPESTRAGPETPTIAAGRPIVVIDPGHGGIDAGALGKDGLLEKDLTLEFGLELARQLKAGGKLAPILTREGDEFLSLADRVAIAQGHHAALFISIHADSVREDYVRGATVYTLSDDASDELAAALAERENRSDILAGLALEDQPDDVADILFDLARRETKNLAIRFAKTLVDDMDGKIALNANPWRRASFRVLKAPDVPSVLLELGYLSNPQDERLFQSESWPAEEAETIADAVEAFFTGSATAGQ